MSSRWLTQLHQNVQAKERIHMHRECYLALAIYTDENSKTDMYLEKAHHAKLRL